MDQLLLFLYQLLSPFEGLLKPMSASNAVLFGLLALVGVFAGAMISAPLVLARVGMSTGFEAPSALERMLRQVRLLRQDTDKPLRERMVRQLYRDGRRDAVVDVDSDFFWAVRILFALSMVFVVALAALVTGAPFLLIIAIAAYNVPLVFASMHNRRRTKRILESLPAVLRRLETRIAAGSDIRDAFAKVSSGHEGPLYGELGWAAGQMAIPGNEPYAVMRAIDERNGIMFFAPLADTVERAGRRGRRDAIDAFLGYIDKILEDDETRRQVRIASLGNKVMLGMSPFLVISLLLAIAAPFIVSFLDSGGTALA